MGLLTGKNGIIVGQARGSALELQRNSCRRAVTSS